MIGSRWGKQPGSESRFGGNVSLVVPTPRGVSGTERSEGNFAEGEHRLTTFYNGVS
jgi:hypothetical protein